MALMTEIVMRGWKLGGDNPFFLISGPCVIESEQHCLEIAGRLKEITSALNIPWIFKASYDKANRTSIKSYRGPGIDQGLKIFQKVKQELDIPVLSDVHEVEQVDEAAEVLDILQIPAMLSRQTDLILAAVATGRIVNIKKGQFLSPEDVEHVLEKAGSINGSGVIITERGVCFGYNNLVSDFRALPVIRKFGVPVVFDATHSVQLPGGAGGWSGGQAEFIPHLARAAVAVGTDGIFMEVHDRPDKALSDGANAMRIDLLEDVLKKLQRIDLLAKNV
ncbi:MAG: 3-deoxy-8-phosphooctulonate synthase [Acidobacteriota bacterium]|nr:3-deoxy-8-phosphooctulonate synthase [Acidobacteriota bacterium]